MLTSFLAEVNVSKRLLAIEPAEKGTKGVKGSGFVLDLLTGCFLPTTYTLLVVIGAIQLTRQIPSCHICGTSIQSFHTTHSFQRIIYTLPCSAQHISTMLSFALGHNYSKVIQKRFLSSRSLNKCSYGHTM